MLTSVASFTDAWIETTAHKKAKTKNPVASFTDAWIETALMSRKKDTLSVASFTDAWIETFEGYVRLMGNESHLLQMRGLKQVDECLLPFQQSRIFYRCVDWNCLPIFSHVGAKSRIFYRCVDWNKVFVEDVLEKRGRIFYRCVDWNRTLL